MVSLSRSTTMLYAPQWHNKFMHDTAFLADSNGLAWSADALPCLVCNARVPRRDYSQWQRSDRAVICIPSIACSASSSRADCALVIFTISHMYSARIGWPCWAGLHLSKLLLLRKSPFTSIWPCSRSRRWKSSKASKPASTSRTTARN